MSVQQLIGNAGIVAGGQATGQAGRAQAGANYPRTTRAYFSRSTDITQVGDTSVGTLLLRFAPPISYDDALLNPDTAIWRLRRMRIRLRRNRGVWNQDSDLSVTLTGSKWFDPGWFGGAPDVIDASDDISLVDWSETAFSQLSAIIDPTSVSSWEPWEQVRNIPGRRVPHLSPLFYPGNLNQFNNCFWDNILHTVQPNLDFYNNPVSGHSGYAFDDAAMARLGFGVNCRPQTFDSNVENYQTIPRPFFTRRLLDNIFTFNCRFQIADDFAPEESYVEFFWTRGVA